MTRKLKVLILYAQYGQGHLQVSRTLKNYFADINVTDVHLVDLFASAHPLIEGFSRLIYEKSFSSASHLYGMSYYLTQNMGHDTQLSKWFHSFGMKKLKEIVSAEMPDLVINTFPMLVMPELKEKNGIDLPVFTVVTDFDFHGRWIHSKVNRFYVATNALKSKMIAHGVHEERIKVTGIPIRKDFEQSVERDWVFNPFKNHSDKKMILIMAGTHTGPTDLKRLCKILSDESELQTVVVCGKNERLKMKMRKWFSDSENLRVFGYVENIHQLMRIASCIVTKSGGVTLSEALRLGLPLFLFRPVPGQEKENAKYLQKKGAAIIVSNIEELAAEMKNILLSPNENRLIELKKAVDAIFHKNAASTIIEDMIKETDKINSLSKGRIRLI